MTHIVKNLVVIEGDLSFLRKRLHKGSIIKGRIVLLISEKHYLLRILGKNLVMKSNLKFERLQEVYFKVLRVQPKIELRVFDLQRELIFNHRPTSMNIVV